MSLFVLAGCSEGEKDVTQDPRFGDFNSAIVGVWRTKVPMTLYSGDFDGSSKYGLFMGDADPYWKRIADFPAGTEIHIDRLMYERNISTSFLWVICRVPGEEHAGKNIRLDPVVFPEGLEFFYQNFHDSKQRSDRPSWTVLPEKLERVQVEGRR